MINDIVYTYPYNIYCFFPFKIFTIMMMTMTMMAMGLLACTWVREKLYHLSSPSTFT